MKNFFIDLRDFLRTGVFAFKQLWRKEIILSLTIGAVLILGAAYGLQSTMQTHLPSVSIDQQLMRDRLFISVCQDSLEQLATSHGLYYDGPGFFSHRAAISLPDGRQLLTELDSLQQHYPDQMEIDDGMLLCPTQKMGGTRYVTIPVVLLMRMFFLDSQQNNSQP